MGVLRDQMIRELQLRRYAAATQKSYLEAVVGLTKHFRIAPDQLSARQVQDYLLYLMTERKLHWNTVNTICSGLTFVYSQTLKRPEVAMAMPLRRTPRQLDRPPRSPRPNARSAVQRAAPGSPRAGPRAGSRADR